MRSIRDGYHPRGCGEIFGLAFAVCFRPAAARLDFRTLEIPDLSNPSSTSRSVMCRATTLILLRKVAPRLRRLLMQLDLKGVEAVLY